MSDPQGAVLDVPDEAAGDPAGEHRDADVHLTVVAFWLSDAARTRLASTGHVTVVDDEARLTEATLVAVSTRLPAGTPASIVGDIRGKVSVPILAIVHPGGENIAVEMLATGATALIAEGNEGAVVAFAGAGPHEAGLVDTYEQSLDRRLNRLGQVGDDRDEVTNLPGPGALGARLLRSDGSFIPRLAFATVVGMQEATRRMSTDARELVRRRLALQFEELCRQHGAEVYAVEPYEFAIVADRLGPLEFEVLAQELVSMTARFSPDRAGGMALAVGHAGPEATSQVETLRELAYSGMRHSAEHPDIGVIGPDRLALSLAAGTELASVLKAIATVEERDAYPASHGERVSRHAMALSEAVGLDARYALRVRLAARLHDIGKLRFDEELVGATPDSVGQERAAEYLTHATDGADMLRASAGEDVATAVAAHHEHWDGSGGPNGLEGEAIPLGGRIIAVADALDRWSVQGESAPDRPAGAAVQRVIEGAGTLFDPTIVDAAAKLFS